MYRKYLFNIKAFQKYSSRDTIPLRCIENIHLKLFFFYKQAKYSIADPEPDSFNLKLLMSYDLCLTTNKTF
jgi:hypothetical protein